MRFDLLTHQGEAGATAAILVDGTAYDVCSITGDARHQEMLALLADWDRAEAMLASYAEMASRTAGVPLDRLHILAPISAPGEIWAAGANYADHIAEMKDTEFSATNAKTISGGRAWHFQKTSRSAVVGHGSINPLPAYSEKVDWEIELAVVIGREGKGIAAADALSYVAGYTIANDLSARDFVARPGIDAASPFRFDWLSHKGFDCSCPLGPWITPARFIKDPHDLDLKLWLNDEVMQDSNTRHMIFDIGEQIEEISARATIHPGDVILTGTPFGVGMSREFFLKSGDNLRLSIEGIGILEHGFA